MHDNDVEEKMSRRYKSTIKFRSRRQTNSTTANTNTRQIDKKESTKHCTDPNLKQRKITGAAEAKIEQIMLH